ncbi:MAG: glutathione S-transferase family protein [Rhizobiales bacterium]|nr:glutathione S-transferase family protein [Hyphomicrobiales bacterium]
MLTLYAKKNAGSVAVEAMLAACGTDYEIKDVQRDAAGALPASLFAVNPRGEVPTLVLPDGTIMTESAAILIHLADIFPQVKLAPALTSPLRPRYLRWMLFLATTIYMSDLRLYYPERYTADAAGASGIKAKAAAGMEKEFEILSDAVGDGPFILGAGMSAADIYAAMLATWAPDVAALFKKHPNIKTLHDRVAAVPAIAKVWARNGM